MFKSISKKWNDTITCKAAKRWNDTITFGFNITNRRNRLYTSYKTSRNLSDWIAYKIANAQYTIGLTLLRTRLKLICTERTVANCLAV